jgi:hypothetical protein
MPGRKTDAADADLPLAPVWTLSPARPHNTETSDAPNESELELAPPVALAADEHPAKQTAAGEAAVY